MGEGLQLCWLHNTLVSQSSVRVTTPWHQPVVSRQSCLLCAGMARSKNHTGRQLLGKMKWQQSGWRTQLEIFSNISPHFFLFSPCGNMPGRNGKSGEQTKKMHLSQLSFILSESYRIWPSAYPLLCPESWCILIFFFFFFYHKAEAGASRAPKGDWSIPGQCGEQLSGASVAAMEVYHHGYLISQLHLREQLGQFSTLSTLPSFFFFVFYVPRPHRFGLDVTERDRETERKSQRETDEDRREAKR